MQLFNLRIYPIFRAKNDISANFFLPLVTISLLSGHSMVMPLTLKPHGGAMDTHLFSLEHSAEPSNPVLTVAAFFNGDFSIDWLQEITGFKASSIISAMELGVKDKLLEKKGGGIFRFCDQKSRKRVEDSVAEPDKEQWHRAIAACLAEEAGNGDDKVFPLSYHLLHTTNDVEGCRWLAKAGDRYLETFQYEDALHCHTKLLKDLEHLDGEEADRLFIRSAIRYSKTSTATHNPKRVITALENAFSRAEILGDRASQALLQMHLAKNHWLLSRYGIAMRHFDRGWSLAQAVDDPRLLKTTTTFSAFFLYWQGRYRAAVEVYEKSVPEIDRFPEGNFPLLAGTIVGLCYCYIGQVSQGLGMMDSIRRHSLEIGDYYAAANGSCGLGTCLLRIHRIDDAFTYLNHAILEAKRGHNEWVSIMATICLAYTHYLKSDKDRALAYLRKYFRKSARVRLMVIPSPVLMDFCWIMDQENFLRIEEVSLENEIERALRSQNVHMQGIALWYRARLAMQEGRKHEHIVRDLKAALELLEESGHRVSIEKAKLDIARQYLLNGEESRAEELMAGACESLALINESLVPEDLRHLAKDSRSKNNLLKEILRLGQEVVAIRNSKDLALHIISAVNRITGAERGAIFLLKDYSNPSRLELEGAKNLTPEEIRRAEFAPFMEMILEAARSGNGHIHMGLPEDNAASCAREVIRSCICVPMILRDTCVGVLYHDNRLFRSLFKESDLQILAYFAGQAAIALDNARVYEEIQGINRKLKDEKQYYEEQHLESLHFENFVGKSRIIMRVMGYVERVAGTDTTAIILGETGVGKELVARAIHRNSPRSDQPFIRVHCSALPESLITSELFGHEKGAFTGATERRIGRFELANGGTLFLDEVGDIPLEVQVRLLRVLQSKEFERVGGRKTLRSDFRLVAATNRNLQAQVKRGAFREDLYYRLNVFPIVVGPLRERKEDIPLLAYYFLKLYANKMGKTLSKIPDQEMEKLLTYDWPGNVRELENVIERGTILSSGTEFQVPELQPHPPGLTSMERCGTLEENERLYIQWALEKTGGKIRGPGGAAELLDIHHNTLYSRMKKLGIHKLSRNTFTTSH